LSPSLSLSLSLTLGHQSFAQSSWPGAASWRHIGPAAFGGRIDDIEAVVGNPRIIFVASAAGGVFRSRNNGVTWDATFDTFGTALSIGDIAIAPSDPNVVWAGTGEPNSRQSSTWGDGVYRSLDGGTTWKHMGLRETGLRAQEAQQLTYPRFVLTRQSRSRLTKTGVSRPHILLDTFRSHRKRTTFWSAIGVVALALASLSFRRICGASGDSSPRGFVPGARPACRPASTTYAIRAPCYG
jgi:hypothetical protein